VEFLNSYPLRATTEVEIVNITLLSMLRTSLRPRRSEFATFTHHVNEITRSPAGSVGSGEMSTTYRDRTRLWPPLVTSLSNRYY